jgi:2-polyprenyl-6-methoxyphenol hydroxylase-like FAD-dependent oxidoreductase
MTGRPEKIWYDVVIVGARVAGAATAMLLARQGLRVLMLDRTRLPADTLSTHALMLGSAIQLNKWGLSDAVAATGATPIDAIDMKVRDISFTAPVKHIGGVDRLHAPRRITLDAIVAEAAVSAGAELCDGAAVTGVRRNAGGRINGVVGVTTGGHTFGVSARWVIGADGMRSTVAKLVGAAYQAYVEPTSSVVYSYWAGLESTHYSFAFGDHVGAGTIPTDGGLTCAYLATPTNRMHDVRTDLPAGFLRQMAAASPDMADQVASGVRSGGFRGFRGLAGYMRQPVGAGWLLVGDAGYYRDPLSAHGITDAFRDAELSARAILAAWSDPTSESAALRRFHTIRDGFAAPMFHATAKLATYDWTTDEALALLSTMGDEGEREARFLAALPTIDDVDHHAAA